jgi:HD superfamily phosphohydrolase YqeK
LRPDPGFPPWAQIGEERKAHVERVARLLDQWAGHMAVPEEERRRWLRAAYLHDALRDADPAELERLAPDPWGVPSLRHGPAAARLAEERGEQDQGVLAAVRYHSVGYAGWDAAGRMLYLADYLEPGRDFEREERRELAARVPRDPQAVLRMIAARRLHWVIEDGGRLAKETVEFWNALVASA